MRRGWRYLIPLWIFLLTADMFLLTVIRERSRASGLNMDACEGEDFRKQQLKPEVYEKILKASETEGDFAELLTAVMLNGDFKPTAVCTDRIPYLKYKRREFNMLKSCYEAVWSDLQYFPIPSGDISYENTWLDSRDYGGERLHEGTDLFGKVKISGYYPVVSMTDGTVEQIGWLPLGGYRIGIRSEHGGYFYYAHLSEYEKEFRKGDTVEAGEILGYMGNTGYGAEGTVGQFPVHLHLGIYISVPSSKELSVNPYWILRAIHKNIINYSY
ncbi:MAG: M23 family metallopeptidase [Blautia sp.]|nr:M23 family metallopeptidase [Blautia sp.]MDY3998664.1 M23 family metallopeptidase [Blautia sp.]